MRGRFYVPCLLFALLPNLLHADEFITVAVTNNFATAARALGSQFAAQSDTEVRLRHGSTEKLYAQIIKGEPFDVFLAVDTERPRLLEASGHGVAGMRFTYATGSLVLWSANPKLRGRDCRRVLLTGDFERLALANPLTASYGKAARDVLAHLRLWDTAYRRLVFGADIAQVMQITVTGDATLGFVSRAQTLQPATPAATCSWPVPGSMHAPINQQLVLLSGAADNTAAKEFLEFVRSPEAHDIIIEHGFGVPR